LIVVGVEMGQIYVDIPDKLEKELRFKTIERFGGRKGRPIQSRRRSHRNMGRQRRIEWIGDKNDFHYVVEVQAEGDEGDARDISEAS